MSITEYLSENYEIESEFNKGKYIAEHDRQITFPVGVHIYFDGRIYEVIRSMSGYKEPSTKEYWEDDIDINLIPEQLDRYSQFATYHTGDIILYNDVAYRCIIDNGYKFKDIRIPMVYGWLEKETVEWQPIGYKHWSVVSYEDAFYTLMTLNDFDNNINPFDSDCWGAIADYDPQYNDYNLEKHMVRLAIYELSKTIAPNNVSIIRMRDYEDSIKWLNAASKLRLNPQIPRKLDNEKQPVTDR